MANSIQDAILRSVDTVITNKVENLKLDKTVVASVVTCANSLTREYKVEYNSGYISAYAKENETYKNGQSVYVLVPQGDFTKKKMILGIASAKGDDENISFISSALSDYNIIGRNVLEDKYNLQPIGLHSYLKTEYATLYKYGEESSAENKHLTIKASELENNLKEAEAIMIEASFKTRLPKAHQTSKTGVYGIQFNLAFNDRDKTKEDGTPEIKILSYILDSNSMTGNPYHAANWTEQYLIFNNIDFENFLYIDEILFFERDFVETSDFSQVDDTSLAAWGADIFLKNCEFYGLKKIGATNGEYVLSTSMPDGNTLKTITSQEQLRVVCQLKKRNENLSDPAMFYWFKEDSRITPESERYQMYGGAGWARLSEKGANYTFTTTGAENKAYENKYKVVCVYKEELVLKDTFTIFNDAAKRDLSIASDLGVKFTFDRGVPRLTCLIDGNENNFETSKPNGNPDSRFKFMWSKIDEYGNTIQFNQTIEQIDALIDHIMDVIAKPNKYPEEKYTYHDIEQLKQKKIKLQGVSWDRNHLTYPVNKIDKNAVFKCEVYLHDREPAENETVEQIEYSIGSATITLQNEGIALPTDYYINIENGDQVFQYSESGVSPDDERYADPLKVKPLTCHFIDPAGLEVNNKTYSIKWKVPLTDSMVVVPKTGMEINPASGKRELCFSEIYPLAINPNYDYQALDNQITAIVTYNGVEYTQETRFTFTKIGENGTNGTDIVAQIAPKTKSNILDKDVLAMIITSQGVEGYNTNQSSTDTVLDFNLYQRNEKLAIEPTSVSWSMADGNSHSKFLSVNGGRVDYNTSNSTNKRYRSQIIKAECKYGDDKSGKKSYYAFFPLTIIQYNSNAVTYPVAVETDYTLKSITYNADGRNPLYNKNQGVKIRLGKDNSGFEEKYFVWYAEGGNPTKSGPQYLDNPNACAFKLMTKKNSKDAYNKLEPGLIQNEVGEIAGYQYLNQVYILPDDVYDGAFSNNLVHCKIYRNKDSYIQNQNPEVEIYIPIYMGLNTYGLKSLNNWDGNHVEINEDENYVLAPQIGAGKKNNKNQFTGILMGESRTYDQQQSQTGLLGYSEGKQSIWLDAETGNAIFGLPENNATNNNQYTEGRIELIPGGQSNVGGWRIGSKSLYRMTYKDGSSVQEQNNGTVSPYKPLSSEPGSKGAPKGAQISIPHDAMGILFNANPPYASFKGKPLGPNEGIDFNSANAAVKENDSFEVEIDPNSASPFTIFRHTRRNSGSEWYRYPLVGINSAGEFYTNAVQNQDTTMGIGNIGAFGFNAEDRQYLGVKFGYGNGRNNILKIFLQKDHMNINDTVYISGASARNNEYSRPLSMHFKEYKLYANSGASDSKETNNKLLLSSSRGFFGREGRDYLDLNGSVSLRATNVLTLGTINSNLIKINNGATNIDITSHTNIATNNININANALVSNISGNVDYNITNGHFNVNTNGAYTILMKYDDNHRVEIGREKSILKCGQDSFLDLHPNTTCMLKSGGDLKIESGANKLLMSYGNEFNITSMHGGNVAATLTLTSQSSGSGSTFALRSPNGDIYTNTYNQIILNASSLVQVQHDFKALGVAEFPKFHAGSVLYRPGGSYGGWSIGSIIDELIKKINQVQTNLNNSVNNINEQLKNKSDKAHTHDYATNQRANHIDNRVTELWSDYGSHVHTVKVDNGHHETAEALVGVHPHTHDYYVNLTVKTSAPGGK